MHRDIRKPLIIFTPKSQLRAKTSRSPLSAFTSGSFEEVLDDATITDPSSVKRIVFASGKVALEALTAREQLGGPEQVPVAVCRVEQLYPWPYDGVAAVVDRYDNADEIIWLQEEPENMGPWNFVKGKLYEPYDDTHRVDRISRSESGSPAAGVAAIHVAEQNDLFKRAFTLE
jgi:2-oxoglutarate dehydrogenase E1 component